MIRKGKGKTWSQSAPLCKIWGPWLCRQRPSTRFCGAFSSYLRVRRWWNEPKTVRIGGVLELITAVVVGAILDLTLFLGKTVIFPSGAAGLRELNVISLSGVILSVLLLHRFKLKVIPLILLGIGFGSIRSFLGF
jgi:hypothetical protein